MQDHQHAHVTRCKNAAQSVQQNLQLGTYATMENDRYAAVPETPAEALVYKV